jgi:hypothetical protein
MQKHTLILLFSLVLTGASSAQIGIKAGLNFANVTKPAGINANSRTGYMFGGYFAPKAKSIIGFRSEIILSRQGYDYRSNINTGNVNLDYLLLPQLITFNFTKKLNLHAGPQAALLLNARSDSNGAKNLFDYFKKFDLAIVGGGEVSLIGGLFIGARINISLSNANENLPVGSPVPGAIPRERVRNNVTQLYVGWRF